ncbi:MAG: manganese efflux pump MntP family protein [Candidatus Bathyarchaeota archaeon]|nr:manganese efflux pump MntP family protein [Candidatus Bathyarchaeota archaeon]
MDAVTVLLVAVGLAMDSFSVSISSGLATKSPRVRDALKIGGFFGFFQAFMPVLGWLGGLTMLDLISGVDHWIAFGLLSLIGCRMMYESVKKKRDGKDAGLPNGYVLFTLSVATSIDALAVGVSLAFLKVSIATPIAVIGIVTFLLSFLGVYLGNRLGHIFENKIGIVGGLILIGIGIKIVLEHMS